MPAKATARTRSRIAAQCDCERRSFPVALSDLTPDGCLAEASCDWEGDLDFLHLTLPDHVEVNGRVLWRRGRQVAIGFFGQIHPVVIDGWKRLAA
jgi:hypothetical protein